MDLLEAKIINDKIDRFINLVNNTIGVIQATKTIEKDNGIVIEIVGEEHNEVSKFIVEHLTTSIVKNFSLFGASMEENKITISYTLLSDSVRDSVRTNEIIINSLINYLYFAVDESKIEFCLNIEKVPDKSVPIEIIWELDEWNYNCSVSEEEEFLENPDNLVAYKIDKNMLYGISLGYYDIDLSVVETDLSPELIGIVYETTERFCYVTAYEDENSIYIYSCVELSDDNLFNIYEGLINVLPVLSTKEQNETLEDVWNDIQIAS